MHAAEIDDQPKPDGDVDDAQRHVTNRKRYPVRSDVCDIGQGRRQSSPANKSVLFLLDEFAAWDV